MNTSVPASHSHAHRARLRADGTGAVRAIQPDHDLPGTTATYAGSYFFDDDDQAAAEFGTSTFSILAGLASNWAARHGIARARDPSAAEIGWARVRRRPRLRRRSGGSERHAELHRGPLGDRLQARRYRLRGVGAAAASSGLELCSVEDHGLIAVHEHAVVEVRAHRAREHHLLEVAPLADQIFDRIPV
jgi:hypothetical protein